MHFCLLLVILPYLQAAKADDLEYVPTEKQSSSNPEAKMNTSQIISYWGYAPQEYSVMTEDGYILTLIRILPKTQYKNGLDTPVVFLQHGLECSSTHWVFNLPSESAAFYFADKGYDVWMGNTRGNEFSKKHEWLNVKSDKYWDFTAFETAKYDLPAMVDFVLHTTKTKQLYYVGYSMGSLLMFIEGAEDEQFAKKIKMYFAIGPMYTLKHSKMLMKLVAKLTLISKRVSRVLFGQRELFSENSATKKVLQNLCPNKVTKSFCLNRLLDNAGIKSGRTNMSRADIILSNYPAGTSSKTHKHIMQMIMTGKCQKYDYGNAEKNQKHYDQPEPPQCDVGKMNIPTVLFYSDGDAMTPAEDIEKYLIPNLAHLVATHKIDRYNHADYSWGIDAVSDVWSVVAEHIEQQEKH